MFGAYVAKGRNNIMIGMMIFESRFLADTFGFVISFIVSAPNRIEFKVIETS